MHSGTAIRYLVWHRYCLEGGVTFVLMISGPAEVEPVLRAPLPQSRRLGFVREIVPPFEGAPPHQQLFISAVSTSSPEDVANFVVVVGQELTSEIQGQRLAEIELSLIRN